MEKQCPKCQAPVVDSYQCHSCQLIFSKFKGSRPEEVHEFDNLKDSRKILINCFPGMFILGFVISNSFLMFLFQFFKVGMHEFGHAMAAWFSGIKATPISLGTSGFTSMTDLNKSFIVFFCVQFLLAYIFYQGNKSKSAFLMRMSIIGMCISLFLTWGTGEKRTEEVIILSGQLGEILFALLGIISFYYHFPQKMHWRHLLRWPSLLMGFVILINKTQEWVKVYRSKSLAIFGVNSSESFGDLNRLVLDFDWSLVTFNRFFLSAITISWIVIIFHYLYFILRGKSKVYRS